MFSQVECLLILRICMCVLLLKFKHAYCSVGIKNPVLGSPRFRMQTSTHWKWTPYVCGVTRLNFADSQYSELSFWASYHLTNTFGGKDYRWWHPWSITLQKEVGPLTVGSDLFRFFAPPARADRQKIFTLKREDRLSVGEWFGLSVKGLICTIDN